MERQVIDFGAFRAAISGMLDIPDSARKARTRARIMSAAIGLFTDRGYRRTSVDEVAEEAAVAKGTVYLHFPSKADLLGCAILQEKLEYLDRLQPIFDGGLPAREQLRMWLQTALVLGTEMPLLTRLLSGDRELLIALDEMSPALRDTVEETRTDFMAQLVDRAAPPHRWSSEEIGERAHVLLGLLYFAGPITNERVRGGLSVERYADVLSEMIVDGVSGAGVV